MFRTWFGMTRNEESCCYVMLNLGLMKIRLVSASHSYCPLIKVTPFILENSHHGDGSRLSPQNTLSQFDRDKSLLFCPLHFFLGKAPFRPNHHKNLLSRTSPQGTLKIFPFLFPKENLQPVLTAIPQSLFERR